MELCAYPCYFYISSALNIWDIPIDGALPPLIITSANFLLLFRVIDQQHRRLCTIPIFSLFHSIFLATHWSGIFT